LNWLQNLFQASLETHNLQPATYNLQPTTCNLQPAACNLQPHKNRNLSL
jgi:hypothetical protein